MKVSVYSSGVTATEHYVSDTVECEASEGGDLLIACLNADGNVTHGGVHARGTWVFARQVPDDPQE